MSVRSTAAAAAASAAALEAPPRRRLELEPPLRVVVAVVVVAAALLPAGPGVVSWAMPPLFCCPCQFWRSSGRKGGGVSGSGSSVVRLK